MNDVEKISSSTTSSKPCTPAYTTFDFSFNKFMFLLKFIERGLESLKKEVTEVRAEDTRRLIEYIRQIGRKVDYDSVKVLENKVDGFISSSQNIMDIQNFGLGFMIEWMPVMIVTTVEAYLIDVLAYAASIDPTLMQNSTQSASYAELTTASSLEEVMAELRYRWARNFLENGGPRSWVERLTKMGARTYSPKTAQEMETLWGIRHLIVHSAGVATTDFTRRHPHM